jgi:hypothetical protein
LARDAALFWVPASVVLPIKDDDVAAPDKGPPSFYITSSAPAAAMHTGDGIVVECSPPYSQPSDDLRVGEVGPPDLVGRCRLVPEFVRSLHDDECRIVDSDRARRPRTIADTKYFRARLKTCRQPPQRRAGFVDGQLDDLLASMSAMCFETCRGRVDRSSDAWARRSGIGPITGTTSQARYRAWQASVGPAVPNARPGG